MELNLTLALSPLVVVVCRLVTETSDVSESLNSRVEFSYRLMGFDNVL
jgi:hypothetical protein